MSTKKVVIKCDDTITTTKYNNKICIRNTGLYSTYNPRRTTINHYYKNIMKTSIYFNNTSKINTVQYEFTNLRFILHLSYDKNGIINQTYITINGYKEGSDDIYYDGKPFHKRYFIRGERNSYHIEYGDIEYKFRDETLKSVFKKEYYKNNVRIL